MDPASRETPRELFARLGRLTGLGPAVEIVPEPEGGKYLATRLRLGTRRVVFRRAFPTPAKEGHFVTLWKRSPLTGETEPLAHDDPFDLCVVEARDPADPGRWCVWVFAKDTLLDRGVIAGPLPSASRVSRGKRGFRVYAPWVETRSRQAAASQAWQNGHATVHAG